LSFAEQLHTVPGPFRCISAAESYAKTAFDSSIGKPLPLYAGQQHIGEARLFRDEKFLCFTADCELPLAASGANLIFDIDGESIPHQFGLYTNHVLACEPVAICIITLPARPVSRSSFLEQV
jgi:hypothetical protein